MSLVNILHVHPNYVLSIISKQLGVVFVLLPIETGSLKTETGRE